MSGAPAPKKEAEREATATIHLQAWAPDSPYARRLRAAPADRIYALYLDERDSHADSTAFYLDVADLLLKNGRRDEALRVLSNLAELDLDNRHVLRVLGYRLMQAKQWALAVRVFRPGAGDGGRGAAERSRPGTGTGEGRTSANKPSNSCTTLRWAIGTAASTVFPRSR